MKQSFEYHPFYFFLSCLGLKLVFDCMAIYASYTQSFHYLLLPLIFAGISTPTISALIMFAVSRDKNMWNDFCQRLRFARVKKSFIPIILLFMPCLILLAISISLLFGYSGEQFLLSPLTSEKALEGQSFLAIFMMVILVCSLEEIGWRGYGIDSLLSKFNLWYTSVIFFFIWAAWHVPSFFIKNGYFQQMVWSLGIGQVLVYFISLFPVTILINWVYIKNNRSILIAILFHSVMNLSYAHFQMQPFTKTIFMILLLIVAGLIVIKDKKLFFKNDNTI